MKQQLETAGISYSFADIIRLIESGWNVSYSQQKMTAFRFVKQENGDEEQLQKEDSSERDAGEK
ncbi:hypothetical protein VU05_05290 [Desulfobulbus sp. F1]|nr:hypothetical protein [Desulfobulbus sp. F1]